MKWITTGPGQGVITRQPPSRSPTVTHNPVLAGDWQFQGQDVLTGHLTQFAVAAVRQRQQCQVPAWFGMTSLCPAGATTTGTTTAMPVPGAGPNHGAVIVGGINSGPVTAPRPRGAGTRNRLVTRRPGSSLDPVRTSQEGSRHGPYSRRDCSSTAAASSTSIPNGASPRPVEAWVGGWGVA